MHQVRLVDARTIIIDMQLLYLLEAFIDVIKLQGILVQSKITHLYRIGTTNILIVGLHNTLHTDVERFARSITDDGCLMVEMSQLTGIVGHLNLKIVT